MASTIACRRITKINNHFSTSSKTDSVLISDSACDQSIIADAWKITKSTGRHVVMTGAFAGRNTGIAFPVVSAIAKVMDRDGKACAAEIHEAPHDDNINQKESLLAVHQALMNKTIGIDDRSILEHVIRKRYPQTDAPIVSHSHDNK